MKKLGLLIAAMAVALMGCSGGDAGTEPNKELQGTPEQKTIESAPGDVRPGGGERDGG